MFMKNNSPVFILLWGLSLLVFSDVLLGVDFRQGDEAVSAAGLMPLEGGLPGTGLLGFYWTWEGLSWAKGWEAPLGGGLYGPPARDAEIFPGDDLYTDWDVLLSHAGKEEALHVHGDLTGDGRSGIADAFFLAARLISPMEDISAPELWRAWRDPEGRLMIHIPADGRLYAWIMDVREPLPEAAVIHPVFGVGFLTESGEKRLGKANLRHPLYAKNGASRELELARISFADNAQHILRIQTSLGAEAMTLPILAPPASE